MNTVGGAVVAGMAVPRLSKVRLIAGAPIATITSWRVVAKKKRSLPPPGFPEADGWKIEIADEFDAIA